MREIQNWQSAHTSCVLEFADIKNIFSVAQYDNSSTFPFIDAVSRNSIINKVDQIYILNLFISILMKLCLVSKMTFGTVNCRKEIVTCKFSFTNGREIFVSTSECSFLFFRCYQCLSFSNSHSLFNSYHNTYKKRI